MPESNSNDSSVLSPVSDWTAQLATDRNVAFKSRGNVGSPFGADTEAKIFSTFTNNGQFLPGVPNYSTLDPTQIPPAVSANDFAIAISGPFPVQGTNILEGPFTSWRSNTGAVLVKSAQPIAGLSNEAGITRLRAQEAAARAKSSKPRFVSRLWP